MAILCNPKRTDFSYKRILYVHFITFAIAAKIGTAFGLFRLGYIPNVIFALFGTPCWCLLFRLGLKFREAAAKLPPQQLSEFLYQTVLRKTSAAVGTMVFFLFEAISCFISQDSLDNGQCDNTTNVAASLSVFLTLLALLSISSKTASKSAQRETAWELSAIATLNTLIWWQRLQGGLAIVTAMTALYLLSWLGVEGGKTATVYVAGYIGLISLVFATILGMIMLNRTHIEHQQSSD